MNQYFVTIINRDRANIVNVSQNLGKSIKKASSKKLMKGHVVPVTIFEVEAPSVQDARRAIYHGHGELLYFDK